MTEGMSAAERAYQALRDDILDGTHRPGDMLGESALAASLNVSRTPVRAALTRLQDEGWISIYPKRGALVLGLSDREIADLADARFVLEATAVDRATAQSRVALAARLEKSIELQREAFRERDARKFIDLTLQFHRGFVEAGGNSVLLELYDRLTDRHRFVLFASRDQLLTRCDEIIDEHVRLTEHLRDGNIGSFARALPEHIREVQLSRDDAFPPLSQARISSE